MQFEIELIAMSTDEGTFADSFKRQLIKLGGAATLVRETAPYRVETSNSFYFEMRRTYSIVQEELSEAVEEDDPDVC